MTDIGKSFNKLIDFMYFKYMGVLGERRNGGIYYDGQLYTETGFKEEVDRRLKLIPPTINRIRDVQNKEGC